jgi:hypothetical protein
MLPFGVTIPATVAQGSEIPEGLMNNPVYTSLIVSESHEKVKCIESESEIFYSAGLTVNV